MVSAPAVVQLLLLLVSGGGDIDQIIATFAQTVAKWLHCPFLLFWIRVADALRHAGRNGICFTVRL